MATCRVVCRLSTRIPSVAGKINAVKSSLPNFSQSKSASSSLNRISGFSRLPVELSCGLLSMMPLHSTIASARLISSLPNVSQKWGLIPQALPGGTKEVDTWFEESFKPLSDIPYIRCSRYCVPRRCPKP